LELGAVRQDPRALLETEARIIAEDDTHIVLAVRIEKATLGRNRRLLAALLDLTEPPAMFVRRAIRVGATLAGVGLAWAPIVKAAGGFLVSPAGLVVNWIATIHALIF
jgi:hypothetical protein